MSEENLSAVTSEKEPQQTKKPLGQNGHGWNTGLNRLDAEEP